MGKIKDPLKSQKEKLAKQALAGLKKLKVKKVKVSNVATEMGAAKSMEWLDVTKQKLGVILERPEYYILIVSAEDQKTLTEFRNTGKTVGEINYADQKLPGVQGDEVILVLRK